MPLPKYTRLKEGVFLKSDVILYDGYNHIIPKGTVFKILLNSHNRLMIKDLSSNREGEFIEINVAKICCSLATKEEAMVDAL